MCDWDGSCDCEGREIQTKLNYVGEGRGHYAQVETYNYVGDGRGSFEKAEETTYEACKPKAFPIITSVLTLVMLSLCFIYLNGGSGDAPSAQGSSQVSATHIFKSHMHDEFPATPAVARQPPHKASAPVAKTPGARYQCSTDANAIIATAVGNPPEPLPCNGGAMAAAAMLETACLIADVDGDGQVSFQDLQLSELRALLSKKVLNLLRSGDKIGNGLMTHTEVVNTLTKAGLLAAGVPGVFSAGNVEAALKEAAWMVADRNGDGHVSRPEMARFARRQQLTVHALTVLHAVDTDEDGHFSHSEFIAALPKLGPEAVLYPDTARVVVTQAAMQVAWLAADTDSDGLVSAREVAAIILHKQLPVRAPFLLLQAAQGSDLGPEGFAKALANAGFSKDFITALEEGHAPDSKVFDAPLALAASQAAAQIVAMDDWSLPKTLWCCEHQGIGCTTRRTTSRHPNSRAVTARSALARSLKAMTTTAAAVPATTKPMHMESKSAADN